MVGDGEINSESAIATQACRNRRLPRLPVIRVSHDNDIGLELVTVGLKEVSKRGRPDFFFAFDVNNNIRAELLAQEGQRADVNNNTCAII